MAITGRLQVYDGSSARDRSADECCVAKNHGLQPVAAPALPTTLAQQSSPPGARQPPQATRQTPQTRTEAAPRSATMLPARARLHAQYAQTLVNTPKDVACPGGCLDGVALGTPPDNVQEARDWTWKRTSRPDSILFPFATA